MEHSKTVGSSTAARVLNCPGSVKLIEPLPEPPASVYAQEGTMLHGVMEALLNEQDVTGFEAEGHVLTDDLYHEMIEPALAMFDSLFDERFEFMIEQKVEFPGIPGAFGTADVVGTVDNYGVVVDWKFGRGVEVEARNNSQLLFAAAATRHTYPLFFQTVEHWKGVIIQPGVSHQPSIWKFTNAEVDAFESNLQAAWAEAQNGDARINDGYWCTFCRAQAVCPVKRDKIKRVQTLGINEHTPPTDLAEMMELAQIAKEWIKAVEKMAHEELERGVEIPGWKLVPKRASRHWTDEQEVEKYLKSVKMKAADLYPRKLVSVAQAEKWLKSHSTKRALTTRMKKLDELQTSVSSGTTLAPSDDKREVVIVEAGAAINKIRKLSQ